MNELKKELNRRNLPSVRTIHQKTAHDLAEWETLREEIRTTVLQEEYGELPPVLLPKIAVEKKPALVENSIWEEVTFEFEQNEKRHVVPTQLLLPASVEKVPVVVYLNFRADVPDEYLPAREILSQGYGLFVVCYTDVTTDDGDFENGLAGLFQEGERQPYDRGKISYWAYMASRMQDYLRTREEVDPSKIGVAGHSRLGKTALVAAATDERFSFVCANDSGCSGAAISRGRNAGGERLSDICKNFPYWFTINWQRYVDKEDELPFDQHHLLALIAPRAAYIGGATEDIWADNESQFLCCVAASEIWELYGERGIIAPNGMPVAGESRTDGCVGFYLREGKHFHTLEDWNFGLKAVTRYLENRRKKICK